ncbi:MAG TPA: NAD(P)-binding oxidoreductase [Anaerolineae bacterium]|nr:NAD(P)-binding oxidoreductase [Anaerolineae bacterium]
MQYLIIGATGAIGSALVRALAAEDKQVRALVRDAEKFHRMLPDVSAVVVTGDAMNVADVRRALEGVDVVFHCINVPLTQYGRTLDAARALIEAALPNRDEGARRPRINRAPHTRLSRSSTLII